MYGKVSLVLLETSRVQLLKCGFAFLGLVGQLDYDDDDDDDDMCVCITETNKDTRKV
jgi:hypothetical protein